MRVDNEWVDLQRQWDNMFVVRLPRIKIVKPQLPESPIEKRKTSLSSSSAARSSLTSPNARPSRRTDDDVSVSSSVMTETKRNLRHVETVERSNIVVFDSIEPPPIEEDKSPKNRTNSHSSSYNESEGSFVSSTYGHSQSSRSDEINKDDKVSVPASQRLAGFRKAGLQSKSGSSDDDWIARRHEILLRNRHVGNIFSRAVDYFVQRRALTILETGVYLSKLQEGKPGKVSECVVGVSGGSLWWYHNGSKSTFALKDVQSIEYGEGSACWRKLLQFKLVESIYPWNCLTLITRDRSLDLFSVGSMGKQPQVLTDSNGKKRLSKLDVLQKKPKRSGSMLDRLEDVSDGLQQLILAIPHKPDGAVTSMRRMRWRRALIKIRYLGSVRRLEEQLFN